jgi:hypothetical protein
LAPSKLQSCLRPYAEALRYIAITEEDLEYLEARRLRKYGHDKEWLKRAARIARFRTPPKDMEAEIAEYLMNDAVCLQLLNLRG